MLQLRKAERKQAKLRVGVSGPSGSGKTYSALLLARGMATSWEKVALIDTENGSGELYSHLGAYNVITLEAPFSPERYIEAIKACEDAGMEVLVIDSVSHEWEGTGGCLDLVDKLGGRYQDWGKVTPRHNQFIQAILQSGMHILTTTRRKQDYEMTKGNDGKVKVEKMGLKEVQRDGFEYELTLAFEVDTRHMAKASKDRTGLFMDKPEAIITEKTGEMLKEWAESGKAVDPNLKAKKQAIADAIKALGYTIKTADDAQKAVLEVTGLELVEANYPEITKALLAKIEADKVPPTPPAEEPKAPETPAKTKEQIIVDLKQDIEYEEAQYAIANEHPTDTAQFRNGLKKTAERIAEMKKKLAELEKPEEKVAPKGPKSKLNAALEK